MNYNAGLINLGAMKKGKKRKYEEYKIIIFH